MGNKRAMLEQITSAKTSQRYPLKFLLPNAFWSGPPIAWSYDSNFRAVSHSGVADSNCSSQCLSGAGRAASRRGDASQQTRTGHEQLYLMGSHHRLVRS